MKQFLLKIMVFGSLFFIVEKGLYFFIQNAPNKEYDKRLELILDGKMWKDVIIIGSSRGANNISAKQLEVETGLSTYNLSYRGSDIVFHEFILKTVLKYNAKPKKVLLFMDNAYQFIDEPTLSFRFDRLAPLKNYDYINDELIKRKKKNYISKFLYGARINRKDFSLKNVNILPVNIMTTHGSKLLESKPNDSLKYLNQTNSYNKASEDLVKLESFKSIQELCKKNDIDLYFVFSPTYGDFDNDFLNRFKALINLEEHIIIYDTTNVIYKNKKLFRDHTHLLKNGAEVFTSEISTFINSKKDTSKNENSLNNRD